jgi:hypothetical protein
MIEEIKTDNNCIVKAFENNPIAILHEDINNNIAEYDSMLEASKAINLKGCTFVYYIKNEKIIDNKYIFRYIE